MGGFGGGWRGDKGREGFQVFAECKGGMMPRRGQGGGGKCTAYLGGEGSPFSSHLREDKVTVIDLRPLRKYFGANFLSEKSSQGIVSFDAYVAIPDVHHSEPLNAVPAGE